VVAKINSRLHRRGFRGVRCRDVEGLLKDRLVKARERLEGEGAVKHLPEGLREDPEATAEAIENNVRKLIIGRRALAFPESRARYARIGGDSGRAQWNGKHPEGSQTRDPVREALGRS
jgi:hypothetical protein